MAFTIPNDADAFHDHQAQPDKVDLDILVAGYQRTGVVSGCAVTAQGTPNMTVAVASGVIAVAGVEVAVASGNVTVGTAHATNPRIDLITVNNAGAKACTAGTAAASPVMPAIPANSVVLAAVYVPASDTAIASNQITDKRVLLHEELGRMLGRTVYNPAQTTTSTTSTTFVDVDATNLAVTFVAPASGAVLVRLTANAYSSAAGDAAYWGLREGTNVLGVSTYSAGSAAYVTAVCRVLYVSGLTAGTSYTYKWAQKNNGGGSTSNTRYGGDWGPAVMEVLAA